MKKNKFRILTILTMVLTSALMFTGCGYTGMRCDNGTWRYVKDDQVQYNFTGMASNDAGWWYFENGLINWNYTGMANNDYGWWFFNNGKLDFNYTGLGHNFCGDWLYQNGKINFNYNGDWGEYKVVGGHVDHKHTYTTVNQKVATCSQAGYSGDSKCKYCSKIKSYGYATYSGNHNTASEVLYPATCLSTGTNRIYCRDCNATISYEESPKLTSHEHTSITGAYEATCYYEGYTGDETCDLCLTVVKPGKTIKKKSHDWEITDTQDATCGHGTIKDYTCKTCYQTKRETKDDKLTHNFEIVYQEPLNCVQDEYTLKQCSKCGEYDEVRNTATGHDYKLSKDGKSIECKNCDSTFTATITDQVTDGKLYLKPYSNVAIGQTLKVDGESPQYEDYNYYEYNKMYYDFWSNMRIETSNADSVHVLKHDYQTGYTVDPCTTLNLDQQDVLRTEGSGSAHIKIYFHDILFDEFDVYVGAQIVDGIKAIRSGQADSSIFNAYSDVQKLNVQAIITMLNETVNDSMTDYQKVVAIKNWYDNNITYQTTGVYSDSLSEIFLNHQGQCEDYAESFSLLMDVLGINCYYVMGTTSNDGLHAWNMIKLDAGNGKGLQWYYADMTWHQFDTTYTVPELNELAGMGVYFKGDSNYRTSEQILKLRQSDYANETEPYASNSGRSKFSDFTF